MIPPSALLGTFPTCVGKDICIDFPLPHADGEAPALAGDGGINDLIKLFLNKKLN